MKIGAVFPQTEIGDDPGAIRDYAQTVEGLGFSHVLAYDHVLGANPERPGGWQGPYSYGDSFWEPFVLFSHMAAVTRRLGFITGVLILPQRETALVAKQAATLDALCGGRFRLGVGSGWNKVEYVALNQDFHSRGRRLEEQVEVLRLLFTQPLVNYHGRRHTIPDAGINPLPVQRPIPIWFGGHAEAVLRRVAELGDGWLPGYRTAAEARPALDKIEGHLTRIGRPRQEIGLEPRIVYGDGNPSAWRLTIEEWQAAGATHLSVNTMRHGFNTAAAHVVALSRFAREMGLDRQAGTGQT